MSDSKFIVIAAPSGSGKTTIVNKLLNDKSLNLSFSISATSRAPRNNEVDGVNYFFLTNEEFIKKIENKEFVEWEEVYKDNFYGTLTSELENTINKNLVFDIDVIGGLNIKKKFPKQTITIFIKPPSIDELENRLRNRNLDSNASIKIRVEKAKDEILLADQFDYIVENNVLENSFNEVLELVQNFINESELENLNGCSRVAIISCFGFIRYFEQRKFGQGVETRQNFIRNIRQKSNEKSSNSTC